MEQNIEGIEQFGAYNINIFNKGKIYYYSPNRENIKTWPIKLSRGTKWTEEPGGLQSMVSQRARNDRATKHIALC